MSEVKSGYIKGKPDIEYWLEGWRDARAFRKKYTYEEKWPDWRRAYRGQWRPGVMPVNIFFKMIRTLVPRIYYRNPSVSITPTKPGIENIIFAKLLERVDNKLLDVMGTKRQMKRAVQNAVMFGTGFMALGFGSEFAASPDLLETSPDNTGNGRLDDFLEYNSNVIPNLPWTLSEHTGNIYYPAGTVDFDGSRWVIQHVTRSLYDLQEDPRLENTKGLLDSKSSFSTGDLRKTERQKDMVDLLIIRDKKSRKVMILAPYGPAGKKQLFFEDDDLQVDGGLPIYPLVFNTDDEVCWGVPDSQIIDPQQKEINETRTLIMRHRRVSIVKMLAQLGAIPADEESKLIGEDVAAIVKVADINQIKVLEPSQIPAALLQSEQMLGQEIQEILGLGVNQFGEYAPGSADRTATEASIVNQATMIRIDERRDMVADMLTNIVRDMHHIIFSQWTNEIVTDIAGPGGVPVWVKFRPEILKDARYDVKTDPDTSLPETKQLREQKAVQTYSILRTNPLVNPVGLTYFLLNNMYGSDLEGLLMSPLGNTSPQNPMTPPELIKHLTEMQPQAQAMLGQWLEIQAKTKLQQGPQTGPI